MQIFGLGSISKLANMQELYVNSKHKRHGRPVFQP